jgi:four helix bundle protein
VATFKEFEDIEAWQKARALNKMIFVFSGKGAFANDFALRDQIRRASISVMSNIAEGFERSGNGEFSQFLAVAKGSVGEVRAQLYAALDMHYLNEEQFNEASDLCRETSRMISGLMTYLRQASIKGTKFRRSNLKPET